MKNGEKKDISIIEAEKSKMALSCCKEMSALFEKIK